MTMENDQGDGHLRGYISDLVLANLIQSPDIFASVLNECNLASYIPLSGALVMTPSQVFEVPIANPNYFRTLVLRASITPSSPILQFDVIKDLVTALTVSGFPSFDSQIPNLYTPIRNEGILRITNLSSISTPSVSYYVETLQISTQVWEIFRSVLISALNNSLGLKLGQGAL